MPWADAGAARAPGPGTSGFLPNIRGYTPDMTARERGFGELADWLGGLARAAGLDPAPPRVYGQPRNCQGI